MKKKIKSNLTKYLDIPFFTKIKLDNREITDNTKYSRRLKETLLSKLDDFLHERPYTFKFKKQEYTDREVFINDLNTMIDEIRTSLWKLYITISKARKIRGTKTFTREQLLQYYYENYLNELYIYTERVLNIITYVEKKAEKLHLNTFYKLLVGARQSFNEAFVDIRKTRNQHNHKERYKDSDFDRLKIIESIRITAYLTQKEKDKMYYSIKKKYCKDMMNEVIELHKSTQIIFVPIEIIVYDQILPIIK